MKPWQRVKEVGRLAPHPVDTRLGFVDQVRFHLDHPAVAAIASPAHMDRMMIGRIDSDGRRYLGNGGYERVNVEESRLNERREA